MLTQAQMRKIHYRGVGDRARVDDSRRSAAETICEWVIAHTRQQRYWPDEALWPESVAYRAELAATLCIASRLLDRPHYVPVAEQMLQRIVGERVDGALWPVGHWCEFPVYHGMPLDWREESARPDRAYTTPIVAYCLGVHHRITGEARFVDAARLALQRFVGDLSASGALDAPARLHHMTAEWVALSTFVWRDRFPELWQQAAPLAQWVRDTLVATAAQDFPFVTAVRLHLLLATGDSAQLAQIMGPAIDAFLASPSWRFDHDRNDFRHIKQLTEHVDVRANGALALVLRMLHLGGGDSALTHGDLYRHLCGWMDAMREPSGACYGCRDIASGRRYGLGSPPHYIQLWWILGGFYL